MENIIKLIVLLLTGKSKEAVTNPEQNEVKK